MGLTKCPDCGGKVSTRAAACPHCGCPQQELSSEPPASADEAGLWQVRDELGDVVGPVSTDQLIRGIAAGRVPPESSAMRTGESEWTALADISEFAEAVRAVQDGDEPSGMWQVRTTAGKSVGPVSTDQVFRGILAGKIPLDATVKGDRQARWYALAEVFEFEEAVASMGGTSSRPERRRDRAERTVEKRARSQRAPASSRWPEWAAQHKYYILGGALLGVVALALVVRFASSPEEPTDEAQLGGAASGEPEPPAPTPQLPDPFSAVRLGVPTEELAKSYPATELIGACEPRLVGGDELTAPTVPGSEHKAHSRCAGFRDVAGLSESEAEHVSNTAERVSSKNFIDVINSMELIVAQVRGSVRAGTVDAKTVWEAGKTTGSAADAVLIAAADLYDGSTRFSKPRAARRPICAVIAEDCSSLDVSRVRAYVRGEYSLGELDTAARTRVAHGKCRQPYVARERAFQREFVRRTGAFAGIGLARSSRGDEGLDPADSVTYTTYSSRSQLNAKVAKLGVLLAIGLNKTEAFWNGAVVLKAKKDAQSPWGDALVWAPEGKVTRVVLNIRDSGDLGALPAKLEKLYGKPGVTKGHLTEWSLDDGVVATLDIGAAAALTLALR